MKVPGVDDRTQLALFARGSFDGRLRSVAEAEGIALFDVDDLYA
jgi:hypothetical protein